MAEEKWLAVYTSPRWERKVVDALTKKKVKTYCPTNKIQPEWSYRKKGLQEPLFASYVFVQVAKEEELSVLKTHGIISFVYWLGKPVRISNDEIEAIRGFLQNYPTVRLEKTTVEMDAPVQIVNDPRMFRKGNVLEVRNSSVKIFLPSLGHAIIAEAVKEVAETGSYVQELNMSI